MWITVHTVDRKISFKLSDISRCLPVKELRAKIVEQVAVPAERIHLYYGGKQMLDDHLLYEYGLNIKEVVILHIIPEVVQDLKSAIVTNGNGLLKEEGCAQACISEVITKNDDDERGCVAATSYYCVGDYVDLWDPDGYGWIEGCVKKIREVEQPLDNVLHEVDYIYDVYRIGYCDGDSVSVQGHHMRPRAHRLLDFDDYNVGERVLVNYNDHDNNEFGGWFEAVITQKQGSRRNRTVRADVYSFLDDNPWKDRQLHAVQFIYRLETPVAIKNRSEAVAEKFQSADRARPACLRCGDKSDVKCRYCSCSVCGSKEDPDKQLLCDECDLFFHIGCLKPPLEQLPDVDDWYCPSCKNDDTEVVSRGEKLKESKKKKASHSVASDCKRDWGRGMACARRITRCTIVGSHHFGPIPGVEVGSSWRYRLQVSGAGVHRPHVSGISGRAHDGAYSIVLSGGYPEDVDEGDVFTYTGSGGRDLSGNKRTASQTQDQVLTKLNKSLALNCCAEFNDVVGAKAGGNWKKGRPVRVVRSSKCGKHSSFCPEEGYRYDGIYKVTDYWPEKGQSNFTVWRFRFCRDDPSPAPWTEAGRKRIKKLGLKLEEIHDELDSSESTKQAEVKYIGTKRKADLDGDSDDKADCSDLPEPKKSSRRSIVPIDETVENYQLDSSTMTLIQADVKNKNIWKEVLQCATRGHQAFIEGVKENFTCVCCQDVVQMPLILPCPHIFCQVCTKRFLNVEPCCPMCRINLKNATMKVDEKLVRILRSLLPGYDDK